MKDKEEFFAILSEIDGQDLEAYQRLDGDFDFSRFVVRSSQFRTPDEGASLFVIRVQQQVAGFPPELYNTPVRRTALEDLLTREVAAQLDDLARFDEDGVARRQIQIARPGQSIVPRTTLTVNEEAVEARLYIQLPALQGRIAGEAAQQIFFQDLPEIVHHALIHCNLDAQGVEHFVGMMEDADQIRRMLATRGWVSFIGENAFPARIPGTDEPDYALDAIELPEALATTVEVSNSESQKGIGVPAGITVILGETAHGRRDLVQALATGVYNHIPGDGREPIVTVPDAVYISAVPDRSVQGLDLRAFLNEAEEDVDPGCYVSSQASLFASQAAATVEALEIGAHVLLYDEDDSAPGFLCHDARLSGLLDGERATVPLAARARQMVEELGVSIVVGGAHRVAEFIPIADTVLRLRGCVLEDITQEAKATAIALAAEPPPPADFSGLVEASRWLVPSSIDPGVGRAEVAIEALDVRVLRFGRSIIDLTDTVQLGDRYQTSTIGLMLAYAKTRYMDEPRPLRELLDLLDRDLSSEGLDVLVRDLSGDLARPRRYEIAATLNRLDTLRVTRGQA